MSLTKVTYSMINGAPANVLDFGAKGDGVTNDTAAIQAAIASLSSYGTLIFPAGTYLFNVDFGSARISINGDGIGKTIIKSYATTSYPITYSGNSSWDFINVSNLTISGKGTREDGGVQYGTIPYVANQQYAGRVIYSSVKFDNLSIAINKRYGNIGNEFHQCSFSQCDVHWYAVGSTSPIMHAGADAFYGCHFSSAYIASIYVDSPVSGSGGLYFDPKCIFESNPGFLLFCKSFVGQWVPGITFDSCWNESNATAATVTLNGVVYTPREFYVNTARSVILRNMRANKVELIASTLLADHCSMDSLVLVKDSDSAIISLNQPSDNFNNVEVYTPTIISGNRSAGNTASVFSSKPRLLVTTDVTPLQAQTFAEGPVTFVGTSSTVATQVNDGQLFNSCVDLLVASGETEYASGTVSTTAARYLVSTVSAKYISGTTDATVSVPGVWGQIAVSNTYWKTFVSLSYSPTVTSQVRLRVVGPSSGAARLRLSAYQTLEFVTLQDALLFIDKQLYAAPSTLPRSIFNTVAPTTGTWNVGDICTNRSPVVGQPKGWRCTVAGTPGTWVSEGNL